MMAIPKHDKLDRPYDENSNMVYDYTEQRYVATVDGIKQNAYINLITDWTTAENAQSYLDLLSRVIYETILSFKDSKYRTSMLYYLAHSKKARNEIYKIMQDGAWYNRRDGGFMMAYNSGANLNQGKMIEFGLDKALSPIAKQIVSNSYLGSRFLPYDINDKEVFADFDSLKVFLVSETYITQDQSDLAESLEDLPYDRRYSVYIELSGEYIFTDLKTLSKAVANMKIYNPASGTW